MKAIVEFGVRGDRWSQQVCDSAKAAAHLACGLSHVFGMSGPNRDKYWSVSRKQPRVSWQSSTHFVSVSILDGEPRGNDTAAWRREQHA
ncbi:hypothetical protein [Paraburkholderia youngii]|uniref:Uncharacterized protein n=1 Tax=Paraburkholderia youngii TaxID=2782701 RepID=A0A7Y6JU39_9BURK|nr:hypothetical protein [Paraburkholderia youngii]NUX98749.1 hypothetical protein [Paraburkholderia youngii]